MGFASKLAASQGQAGYPPSGGPPGGYGGYPPQGQQRPSGQGPGQGQYPGPQQYQAYPGSARPGAPQGGPPSAQGQYMNQPGGYPPQGGQYGGPAQPGSYIPVYRRILQDVVNEKNLHGMYPPKELDRVAERIGTQVDQLCAAWHLPREIGMDLVKLALFDIILYIDNSGSIVVEEDGERLKDLKAILTRVAFAAGLFDQDGIQVRFMNDGYKGDNIRTEAQVAELLDGVKFSKLTPLGTNLKSQVLDPLVVMPARAQQLRKPVLVITITDGQPAGEGQNVIFDVIRYAVKELGATRYGTGAISFQFAQVGNDLKARDFLSKLDKEPAFGGFVDCTSNFEVEQEEMSRQQPPVDLTPELWLVKLLLGAIDSSYDRKDESANRPAGGPYAGGQPGGPVGAYGAPAGYAGPAQSPPYSGQGYPPQPGYPPQSQPYGQPPAQYGGGPAGQYGPPTSQYGPPSQGYNQGYGPPPAQYGQAPQGYGQAQQYGQAPPRGPQGYPPRPGQYPPQHGGGYPAQGGYNAPPQGGYNAPPPPSRY